jgi:hypothetical protein
MIDKIARGVMLWCTISYLAAISTEIQEQELCSTNILGYMINALSQSQKNSYPTRRRRPRFLACSESVAE